MKPNATQGELFINNTANNTNSIKKRNLALTSVVIEKWQAKICRHQAKLFNDSKETGCKQVSLFNLEGIADLERMNPLRLTPLPLSFWRWPSFPHDGPAIYLVMDRPKELSSHLLLYVGETIAAERRWKGEHDCKSYLSAYSEALNTCGMNCQLSIRFWTDVPRNTKARRKLEQLLIKRWLPPFNKENWSRWATPFTAEI